MKKLFLLLMALFTLAQVKAQEKSVIQISTDNTDLILQVAPNGRLYQAYLGDKLLNEQDLKNLSGSSRGWEVYPGSGGEDYFEPAVAITNNDGNLSTILRYVSSEQKAVEGGTETIIRMKDVEGYEIGEIAEITGSQVEAIRSNLSRARKKIREQFLLLNKQEQL